MLLNTQTRSEFLELKNDQNVMCGIKSKVNEWIANHNGKPKRIIVSIDVWQRHFMHWWRSKKLMGIPVCTESGLDVNEIIVIS